MRLFLLILLAPLSSFCFGQIDTTLEHMPYVKSCEELPVNERNICTEKSMYIHIAANQKYPQTAKDNNIQGQVIVSFLVDSAANVVDVEVIKGIVGGEELEEEAIRVVKLLNQLNWFPGYYKGIPVNIRYRLPIKFSLQSQPPTNISKKKSKKGK